MQVSGLMLMDKADYVRMSYKYLLLYTIKPCLTVAYNIIIDCIVNDKYCFFFSSFSPSSPMTWNWLTCIVLIYFNVICHEGFIKMCANSIIYIVIKCYYVKIFQLLYRMTVSGGYWGKKGFFKISSYAKGEKYFIYLFYYLFYFLWVKRELLKQFLKIYKKKVRKKTSNSVLFLPRH